MSTDSDTEVSRKLVPLLMLLSGSRVNPIWHFKITNMYLTDKECTFVFDDVLKHSRPSFKEKSLVFRAFLQNPKLCPVSTLIQYLDIRLSRSSDTTMVRSYKGPSSDTIGRWIKNTMQKAGISTGLFSPHSCRSATTSKADTSGTSITTILQSANWSRTSTFKKLCLKVIQKVYPNLSNEEIYLMCIQITKEKYFVVLHVYITQERRFMF